jgi:hypothetical protein
VDAGVAVEGRLARCRPETVPTPAGTGRTLVNADAGPAYQNGVVDGRSAVRHTVGTMRRLPGRVPASYLSGPSVDALDVGMAWYLDEPIVFPHPRSPVARRRRRQDKGRSYSWNVRNNPTVTRRSP